jgi:hypothetical protein
MDKGMNAIFNAVRYIVWPVVGSVVLPMLKNRGAIYVPRAAAFSTCSRIFFSRYAQKGAECKELRGFMIRLNCYKIVDATFIRPLDLKYPTCQIKKAFLNSNRKRFY